MVQASISGLTVSGQNGPRPTVTDEMKLKAALPVAKKMLSGESDNPEAAAKDIAYHGRLYGDGYQLGKDLEYWAHWDISRDDVDTLDEFSLYLERELEKAEQEWATVNQIQPPHPIGTMTTKGKITGVYEHGAARYLVKPNDYVEDDTNRRLIIKFEDAVPVSADSKQGEG